MLIFPKHQSRQAFMKSLAINSFIDRWSSSSRYNILLSN